MTLDPPAPRRSNLDTQPIPIGVPPAPAGPRRRALVRWGGGAVAVLILGGAVVSYLRMRPAPEVQGADAAHPDLPPALRPYLDRAQAGDPSAMRMLGTMYYNGLNVTQDTREGIRWYRKAAAAGSAAARRDLEQLHLEPGP
jgi:TPR repeat protein